MHSFRYSVMMFTWTPLLLIFSPTTVAAEPAQTRPLRDIVGDMVKWVVSRGGFVSEKIDIRESSSGFAVFARSAIRREEELMKIQGNCIISFEGNHSQYAHNLCSLAMALHEELQKGSSSDFAPYVEYLLAQPRGQIPATWSEVGKQLYREMAMPNDDIVDWIQADHVGPDKCWDVVNETIELALALTVQRGFDLFMIPLWDFTSHTSELDKQNVGAFWSTDANDENLTIMSITDIPEGGELVFNYWQYSGTRKTSERYVHAQGVLQTLADFGFVENYPQRWVWDKDKVWFQASRQDGRLKIDFSPHFVDAAAEVAALRTKGHVLPFLEHALGKFVAAESRIQERAHLLPRHEAEVLERFRRDGEVATKAAIASFRQQNVSASKEAVAAAATPPEPKREL